MLNDIRLHLDSDEITQSQIELDLANKINAFQGRNVKAFNRYVPSIGKLLTQLPFERLSVFVDKNRETNIVDFQSGITLYGPNVDSNIYAQVNAWSYNSALLDFTKAQQSALPINTAQKPHTFSERQLYTAKLRDNCTQDPIDTLVILGLGKGDHIRQFFDDNVSENTLNTKQVRNLVIYEPDWEVFRCTLSLFDWAQFLSYADQRKLQIFFQVGTNIHQMFDDITELHQQLNAKRMLFYKHTNLPVFIQIISNIQQGKWGRALTEIHHWGKGHQHHHLHVFSSLDAQQWQSTTTQSRLFKTNMALFEEYFPNIHAAFINYKPVCWETLTHKHSNTINLFNRDHGNFFGTSDPQKEGQLLAKHFSQYPNLDGLVFGYEGDKLRHYMHNTFIRQADMLLRENEESQGELPNEVKALMVFGLGPGYMLDALYQKHNIQHLIICEPNPDFFYASLHAIDWTQIFDRANEGEHKLYINIGEASSQLFKDLMSQFLVIGPHVLNETFIMQSYHNPLLHQVLSEVRQQLQVIFAMGENFDHVAYGIAHTVDAMQKKTPALRYQPSQYLSKINKQTPIFIVGNGPSLDQSIDIIKAYKGESIVVSCGTALQALYKNGITPDFHGEVEQNRANFDWASRINDRAYLKKISLLSINGIHPDTCNLYKNVLIAFKSGESSTHALLAMLPKNSFHCLDHAYPTVTNMAMSFFLSMGFEQLYLVGVDLGFADQSKHHSSASGYYEDGKQIYDYQKVHAADLRVKGNRQDWVFTKTEFNISRMIVEQLLLETRTSKERHVECFNLSDGVFIEGTMPLDPESVLVTTSKQDKQDTLAAMDDCFMSITSDLPAMLATAYQKDLLEEQLESLTFISNKTLNAKSDIYQLIDELRGLLLDSKEKGKSLFFYYFFNSINYLSAALNKASLQSNEKIAKRDCSRLLDKWRVFLGDATQTVATQFEIIDTSDAFGEKRERFLLGNMPSSRKAIKYYSSQIKLVNLVKIEIAATAMPELELIASFEELVEIITASEMNGPLLIDIYKETDIDTIIPVLSMAIKLNNFSKVVKIGLVFHHYSSLLAFSINHPDMCSIVCLLYCSPLLDMHGHSQAIEEGAQDFLLADEYWHVLRARGQDLSLYSQIIVKPRFSETGLQNTYLYNKNGNNSVTHNNYTSATMQAQSAFLETDETAKCESRCVKNNEYESVSVAVINHTIATKLLASDWYMFKYYIAIKKPFNTGDGGELTIVDNLENRGRKMNRLPFDFELIGAWQSKERSLPS